MLKRRKTATDEQVQADEANFRFALSQRGIKRRDADGWIADVFEMAADEPALPSDDYLTFVMSEEGVSQADADWYWNLRPYVRSFFKHLDDLDHLALYGGLLGSMSEDYAASQARKAHPYYGDPRSPLRPGQTPVDRLLPWEVKDRVDLFIERRSSEDARKLLADRDASSSFNALVRTEMAAGRL